MSVKSILIVDDDPQFAESIALRCRDRGWQAQTAGSPLAAVMSLMCSPPDLVCLDVNMPTGNGLDICEHVMKEVPRAHVPVIVLTGRTDRETIGRTSRLRARYIHKSTDLWQRLQPVIEELLEAPDSSPREPTVDSTTDPLRTTDMVNTKRILIADDDEDLLQVLEKRFSQMGLRVDTACDGMSAVHKIDSLEPDLVILDINMPYGSGLDVCQMASREPLLKTIPVIILTGRKDQETILRCRNLQAHYVANCPDVWATLAPLVRQLLGLNEIQDEQELAASEEREPAIRRAEGEHPHPPAIHAKSFSQVAPPANLSSAPAQKKSDEIQNRYFDAIFSALGWSEAHKPEIRPPASPNETRRPCILCIDDDADFSNSLKLRLQQHGFDVDQACAGMAGYRQAFTSVAQAIILDFQMPDGNGAYILRRLKENPVTSGIPTIVLTGRKDKALERTIYNLGASRFLTKPVEWDKLFDELDKHVRRTPEAAAS